MRELNKTVSQHLMGDGYRYFVYFDGDEWLLNATNDEDAITQGAAFLKEMEEEPGRIIRAWRGPHWEPMP